MFNLFKTKPDTYQNIQADKFRELQTGKDVVVLDVRTAQERADENIPGSIHVDLFNPKFEAELDRLDPSKTYLVYCRSGNRSAKACRMMGDKGFTRLYNLSGGIGAWMRAR
ncbi:MAG: rhodanese-like domain-containing protein [Tunicatimonas sp.]